MKNLLQTSTTTAIDNVKELLRLEELRNTIINTKCSNIDDEKINKCFAKLGIDIVKEPTMQFRLVSDYTGKRSTDEQLQTGKLILEYRVGSTKIKPVLFAGYAKSGAGRNHGRLVAKAKKIEEQITALTGYECNINQYGMEVKTAGDPFNFSITFSF